MRGQERGFTLIELVVVITILGILAAVALPKFVDVQSDARVAAIDGVASAVHGTASLVYAKAMIEGKESAPAASNESVTVQGATISLDKGYPTAASLGDAMTYDGVTYDGAGLFSLQTGCTVTYTSPGASVSYSVVKDTGGC